MKTNKTILKNLTPGISSRKTLAGLSLGMLLSVTGHAQFIPTVSGGWDGAKLQGAGYNDYGSGVVRLLDGTFNGCEGAGVYETSATYNPCSGNFNKCYQVVFGCDDAGADGLAFMFSTCSAVTDYQVWGCGGGLGYVDACPGNKGITIEFDTFNNGGVDDFDTGYEGTGTQDQVAIHKNMQAKTAPGKITGAAVANLEDGQEHTVCISYNNTTHILSATIDGTTVISYDMDNSGTEFQSYFFGGGCGGLNQSWTAGTNGGFNNQVVSNGPGIYATTGEAAKPCPQMLPVEFLAVDARTSGSSVLLSWTTATELNNDKFIIERSSDMNNWEMIGTVDGAGTSVSLTNYRFEDQAPLNGTSYYRIRQVDFDHKYAYSNTVSVNTGEQIVIAPNPFNEAITINMNTSGIANINIYDVMGQSLYQSSGTFENGALSILPELSPGHYTITIQTETSLERREIIKSK